MVAVLLAKQLPISIHPPRAGWDCIPLAVKLAQYAISIHPPRAGWDHLNQAFGFDPFYFNPPTPCGVGLTGRMQQREYQDFNPPTPCGVGRADVAAVMEAYIFQSTHPVRGGTISWC